MQQHLRIAALQCNFEGGRRQTLRVPRLWARYGFDTEQLLHTHAELYSAVFDVRQHGALLKKYLAEARRNKLKVILYLNCHILLPSQEGRAAEWAVVDKDGKYIKLYKTYYGCCVNSSWTDYFLGVIDNLAQFDLYGIFLDGPVKLSCFCRSCRQLFKQKYGKSPSADDAQLLSQFALESMLNFLERVYARVKQVNSKLVVYNNVALLHSSAPDAAGMRRLLACNDLIGTEGGFQFYGAPSGVPIWRCGLQARAVDAVAGEKPRVIFMAADHKPWAWYLHTPSETRLCYASALANGASVWYGLHSATRLLRGKTAQAAAEMVRFDKRHAALYAATTSAAEIALFHSFDTAAHYRTSGEATDFYDKSGRRMAGIHGDYHGGLNGAAGLLFRTGLAFDVATELNAGELERYRALVIPNAACMSKETAQHIENFARGGGWILADGDVSLFDEHGKRRPNFLLSTFLGARFQGYQQFQTHDYFTLAGAFKTWIGDDIPFLPAPLTALHVKPLSAQVCGRLCPPLPGCYAGAPGRPIYPFILCRRHGQGGVCFIAGMFFEMYAKYAFAHYLELVQKWLLAHVQPQVELLGGNGAVEFTVRRCVNRPGFLIHLVNYTGAMVRPIDKITPLADLALRVRAPLRSARALAVGKNLAIGRGGIIKLPPLNAFEVVWAE